MTVAHLTVDGEPEEITIEVGRIQSTVGGGKRPRASKPGDICTHDAGHIVDVLVKAGQVVSG